MPHPSYEQAKELARWYAGLALSVSMYRFNNWNALSEEERRDLEQKHWSLESYSQDFLREAAQLVFADVAEDLGKIGSITQSITKDLAKLKAVKHVLDIIGATMTLAGAIISKDTGTIAKQAQTLADNWKALHPKDAPQARGGDMNAGTIEMIAVVVPDTPIVPVKLAKKSSTSKTANKEKTKKKKG